MDDSEASKIAQFASEMGVNYPVLLGTDKIAEDYGNVEFLPTSFYIDREGKIVGKGTGLLGREEIEQNVQRALTARSAGMNQASRAVAAPDAAKQQPRVQ